jgi:ABC-type transport system substrate-binding protein
MESLWNPSSPLNQKGLIDTDGDQDRAKQILKDIAWDPNTEVPIGVVPGFQTHQLLAETISGELSQVGIKAKIVPMEGGDIKKYTALGGVHIIGNVNQGVASVSVPARGASLTWNPCGYSDPTLNGLLDKLSTGDIYSADLAPTWKQVQETILGQHLWYPLVTQPSVYVYDAGKLAGLREGTIGLTGATQPSPFLDGVYVKTK